MRISFTVDEGAQEISVQLEARTLGWLAFGLMGEGEVSHGMVNTDMWF